MTFMAVSAVFLCLKVLKDICFKFPCQPREFVPTLAVFSILQRRIECTGVYPISLEVTISLVGEEGLQ